MDNDPELTTYLATHAAHADLVNWGFVKVVSTSGVRPQYQVAHPPAIIEAIRTGQLVGEHARIAAGLVLQCTPPKGFWYATSPEELIDYIQTGQPL